MTSFEREVFSPLSSESGFGAVRDLEHEFARALAQAELYGARLDDRLRQVLHRVVDTAKASGKSTDDIVVLVKDIARRGGFARPDAVRPVASFPADRLITKAITACIERYHESDDDPQTHTASTTGVAKIQVDDLTLIASGGDTRGAVGARLRAVLTRDNEDAFTRALASYVRSAPSRGLDFDGALTGVNRILDAVDDGPTRMLSAEHSRARQLILRGLLLAVYERQEVSHEGVAPANHPPVRSSYLKPADRSITQSR